MSVQHYIIKCPSCDHMSEEQRTFQPSQCGACGNTRVKVYLLVYDGIST